MADYIYLLENRLSRAQRDALQRVREIARSHGMTVFLVGGAVRDLTSGAPIRDLDVAVQGDARALAEELGAQGKLVGTNEPMQSFYFSFPGGVRVEVSSALSVTYPEPGKAVVQPASMLEDLRRRDFTANAMAISLNEGSYGLLMDPANGVADVENRELRLLSNYGFLEEPSRLIRATRLLARLGWQMEEKTRTRYDNAKAEGYLSALPDWERRYEAEAIFREEDPLYALRKLEAEGWVSVLSSALASAKVDGGELDRLREITGQLNALGIFPDTSAAVFPLLTAKMSANEVAGIKKAFALPGFAAQIEALDESAKALAAEFTAKGNAAPSASWKLLMAAEPEAVLWMAFNARSGAAQNKLKLFFQDWPQARTKIPYQQMQEMRIHPEMQGYDALLDDLFFAAMDGKLDTPEAIKAFLEPYSPPAAPPPPTLRRRAVKRESKASKSRAKKAVAPETELEADDAMPAVATDSSHAAEPTATSAAENDGQPAPSTIAKPASEASAAPGRVAKRTEAKPEKVPATNKAEGKAAAAETVAPEGTTSGAESSRKAATASASAASSAAAKKAGPATSVKGVTASASPSPTASKAVSKTSASAAKSAAKPAAPAKSMVAAKGAVPAKGSASAKPAKKPATKGSEKNPKGSAKAAPAKPVKGTASKVVAAKKSAKAERTPAGGSRATKAVPAKSGPAVGKTESAAKSKSSAPASSKGKSPAKTAAKSPAKAKRR